MLSELLYLLLLDALFVSKETEKEPMKKTGTIH